MFMKNELPRGCINVYEHNIQTSSSLKVHGQSKPNFIILKIIIGSDSFSNHRLIYLAPFGL